MPSEAHSSKPLPLSALRWRCRRGMRELDVLLGHWLERQWAQAPDERRLAFGRLLEQEDDAIWDWLMGRAEPPADLGDIVAAIRVRTDAL